MNALIKDCIKLVTITVIAGAALGAVYGITKEPIAAQEAKTQMEAYAAVFPDAAEFEEVADFTPEAAAEALASGENPIEGHEDDEISSVVEAVNASGEVMGYIFNVTTAEGYGWRSVTAEISPSLLVSRRTELSTAIRSSPSMRRQVLV